MTGNRCIFCGEKFQQDVNVFTLAGWKETKISGSCERCFDALFEEKDDNEDE